MAESKRIIVSLPDSLLKEVDDVVCEDSRNRSKFIRDAMRFYLNEVKRMETVQKMIKGYQDMAEINVTLAEVVFTLDNETITRYELRLAECE